MPLSFAPLYDDPDVLLALSLSLPVDERDSRHVTTTLMVEIDDDVRINIPRAARHGVRIGRMFSSKEGIAFALLLRRLLEMQREESYLRRRLSEVARQTLADIAQNESRFLRGYPSRNEIPSVSPAAFVKSLDVGPDILDEIDDLTYRVLRFLEDEGLIVDPFITGTSGMMVLLGMVPVRWSVRTPKGQRVYREISVRAGLWTLDIRKLRSDVEPIIDWDFRFRGLQVVKRLIRGLAEEYLAIEHRDREDRGKPNVALPHDIELD